MWELEMLRDTLRQAVNPSMDRREQKDFTDYVMAREAVVQDYVNQAYRSVQNFLQDREKEKPNVELQTAWRWHQRKNHQG